MSDKTVNDKLVERLRSLAREGQPPSQMLREIVSTFEATPPDRALLVRYFSEAFCFTEGQAFPIFGWFPDGSGQLQDAELDYLLSKRIRQNRAAWENEMQ